MESRLTFDHSNDFAMTHSLIQKYNVPGPRYTSYPTVPYWNEIDFSYEIWLATLKKSFVVTLLFEIAEAIALLPV